MPTVLHGLLAHPVFRAVAVFPPLIVLIGFAASNPAVSQSPGDLALRDVHGRFERTLFADGQTGETWLDAVIDDGSSEFVRVRLAPAAAIERSGFELREGDPIQIRFFVSEDPPAVQRIRNLRTGAVLRLRCLHGEPLWDRQHRRGRGPHGAGGRESQTTSVQ